MKEVGEVVEVRDTASEASEIMIEYIYTYEHGDWNISTLYNISCAQGLFELLSVADRYEILNLATIASYALDTLPINKGNVVFVATVAKKYKRMYEDKSREVLVRCLKFVYDTTLGDIFALISSTRQNFSFFFFYFLKIHYL